MKRFALALGTGAFVAPLLVAFAACSVDGATPDCTKPNAGCEPSAPNPNPDARAFLDGRVFAPETGADSNAPIDADAAVGDAATDGPAFDGDGGAKADGDAKTG